MIELPEIFRNDIQGNTTNLVPLVVLNNRLYLSTQKTKLDKTLYHPFLHKMGKITEGVEFDRRKYKISNLKLDFYNYNYGDKKLLDAILRQEAFNTTLEVYFKSQNCKTLDDCLKVYSGYIKNIEENKDFISIDCEDKTEQALGKEIPQRFTPTEGLEEKYGNIPIPIVYGEVDRSPLVYQVEDRVNHKLISDDFHIKEVTKFLLQDNEGYFEIMEEPDLFEEEAEGTLFEKARANQYTINDNNEILIDKTVDLEDPTISEATETYLGECSPLRYGFVQVYYNSFLKYINGNYSSRYYEDPITYGAARIGLYKGIDDDSEDVEYLHEGYLDVRDFGTIHDSLAHDEHWLVHSDYDYMGDEYRYWGQSWLNLQLAETLPNDDNVAYELKRSFLSPTEYYYEETKNITPCKVAWYQKTTFCVHGGFFDHLVEGDFAHGQLGSPTELKMNIHMPDTSSQVVAETGWDNNNPDNFFQNNPTEDGNYIAIDGEHFREYESLDSEVGNPDHSISSYYRNWLPEGSTTESGATSFLMPSFAGGSLKWMKFDVFEHFRKMILKDFQKYDLYAHVYGRVDSSDLRYTTSITTQTTQGRAVTIKAEAPKMTQKTQARGTKSSTKRKLPVKTKQPTQGKGGGY